MAGLTIVYLILEESTTATSCFASLSAKKRDEVFNKLMMSKESIEGLAYYYKDSIRLGVVPESVKEAK